MAALSNPRHERFAQELAKGKSQIEAYEAAGYRPNPSAASRMSTDVKICERVAEITERGAIRAEITVASLLEELEQARAAALGAETPQSSAAVAASMSKAKLLGLVVDKSEAKVALTTQEEALDALR